MKPTFPAIFIGVVAAACGGDAPAAELPPRPAPVESTVVDTIVRSQATRIAVAKRVAWKLDFQGAGPMRPGISLARAIVAMEGDLWQVDGGVSCSHFRAERAPGMTFVFLDKVLARIEVENGTSSTPEGIKIGATEEQVQAAYSGRVSLTNDTESTGHFLTVSPADAADSALRMVFETDGKRVTRFRSGVRPVVGWVEGCS